MIKEIAKILENVDVQITFTEHPEGMKSRLIFIPRKKGMRGIIPIEAWGTDDEVNNSIRYELDKFAPDYKENVSPLVAKIVDNCDKEKEKIVKISGVPKDNIIVAKPKPIIEVDDTKGNVTEVPVIDSGSAAIKIMTALNDETIPPKMDEVEKEIKLKEINAKIEKEKNTVRCAKCELPKDSHKEGTCIYPDCPEGHYRVIDRDGPNTKPLTPEENKLRNAMIKEEDQSVKLVFKDKKEVETKRNEVKIIPEELASRPVPESECYDPEYGHCNSIDNEGENDDLPRALQDVEEEEISEQEQMEIDSRNAALNKAQPFTAPTFNF